jgi:hypothetical protein
MSAPGLYASDRKTAGELKVLAEKHGWKARELNFADLQRMSSKELNFHEQFNAENLKKAMDEPALKAKARKQALADVWTAQDLGEDKYEAIRKAGTMFTDRYPQFIKETPNSDAITSYIQTNGLDLTEVHSYETAFQALAARGELHLNPSALGLGTEERISGHSITSHPKLYLLLRPAPSAEEIERQKTAKMSAAEWKKSRPELQDGLPFVIQQQFFKAAHSLASFEPEYVFSDANNAKLIEYVNNNRLQFNLTGLRVAFNAIKDQLDLNPITVQGQVTQLTDYEPREVGQPEAPGKLRAKVARMSSSEMATFLRENPSARRAIDGV